MILQKNLLSACGCLTYFTIGILQVVAITVGINAWWHWHCFFSVICALFVGYIPIIGTIISIFAAMKGLQWSLLFSLCMFCWPYLIYAIAIILGSMTKDSPHIHKE
ncbi:MAG: hypothetical protein WCS73_00450 [Lentisphaeria bacterium]